MKIKFYLVAVLTILTSLVVNAQFVYDGRSESKSDREERLKQAERIRVYERDLGLNPQLDKERQVEIRKNNRIRFTRADEIELSVKNEETQRRSLLDEETRKSEAQKQKNKWRNGTKEEILAEVKKRHIKFNQDLEHMKFSTKHYSNDLEIDARNFKAAQTSAKELQEVLDRSPKNTYVKMFGTDAKDNLKHTLATDFKELEDLVRHKKEMFKAKEAFKYDTDAPLKPKKAKLAEIEKKFKNSLSKIGGGRSKFVLGLVGMGAAYQAGAETIDADQKKESTKSAMAGAAFKSKSWAQEPAKSSGIAAGAQ